MKLVGFEKIKKSSSEILSLYESLNDDFWDLIKAGCRYKAIPEGFKVVDKIIFADRVSEYNEYWSGNFVVIFKLLNSEKDILIFKTKLDQNYFQNGAVELQPFRNECSIEEYWTELKKLKTTFMSHLILNAHYKTKNNHEVLFYSIVNLFN